MWYTLLEAQIGGGVGGLALSYFEPDVWLQALAGHLPSQGAGVPRLLLQLIIRPKVVNSEYLNTIYGQGC
jgi:hypothetical protein